MEWTWFGKVTHCRGGNGIPWFVFGDGGFSLGLSALMVDWDEGAQGR